MIWGIYSAPTSGREAGEVVLGGSWDVVIRVISSLIRVTSTCN